MPIGIDLASRRPALTVASMTCATSLFHGLFVLSDKQHESNNLADLGKTDAYRSGSLPWLASDMKLFRFVGAIFIWTKNAHPIS
jgi:hypothetical protein